MSDRIFEVLMNLGILFVWWVLLFPFAFVFGIAWNHVAPAFDWPHLDYWQGFALLFVTRFLFPFRGIRVKDPR